MTIPRSRIRRFPSNLSKFRIAYAFAWTIFVAVGLTAQVSVLTYQYDNTRAGSNLKETLLTPQTVKAKQFGRLFRRSVDGSVYAQPLYLPKVKVGEKGTHNVVYVVTEHDSAYAFDADDDLGPNATALWHVSLIDPANGVTAVPSSDYLRCPAILPEIGITSTPVIDPTTNTIYLEAMTKETVYGAVEYVHRLHALDAATGKERAGSPIKIEATIPGTGDGTNKVAFTAQNQKQRPGMLLLNGVVYMAWSSQCERRDPYHGWLLGYDAKTLRQVAVFNDTPNGAEGSFWESGVAPAADEQGNIFLASGNGTFDGANGGPDFGQSYIRIRTKANGEPLLVNDYFTPFNVARLNRRDIDLGSGGVVLLPDDAGTPKHPHLLIGAGKEGRVYVLDRDKMGGHELTSDQQIVQSMGGSITSLFGKPVYFYGSIFFCGAGDSLKQFAFSGGRMENQARSQTSLQFEYPGCVPTISSNGTSNGIVWLLEDAGVLHAYDAANLARELYNSSQVPDRDALGSYVKFSVPIVANGKVYAGTMDSLVVYGLLSDAAGSSAAPYQSRSKH
jgi:hypothetical protein